MKNLGYQFGLELEPFFSLHRVSDRAIKRTNEIFHKEKVRKVSFLLAPCLSCSLKVIQQPKVV